MAFHAVEPPSVFTRMTVRSFGLAGVKLPLTWLVPAVPAALKEPRQIDTGLNPQYSRRWIVANPHVGEKFAVTVSAECPLAFKTYQPSLWILVASPTDPAHF